MQCPICRDEMWATGDHNEYPPYYCPTCVRYRERNDRQGKTPEQVKV